MYSNARAASRRVVDLAPWLDAEVAAALRDHPHQPAPLDDVDPRRRSFAAALAAASGRLPPLGDMHPTTVPVPVTAGPAVDLRVLRPNARGGGLAVVYLHGGGLISGSARMYDQLLAVMARASGATFVSVDYRLAPEHPWPAALQDAHAAYTWVLDHAGDDTWDRSRIALMGDSAGGLLATALAALLRDRGETAPGAQLLVYPMVDRPLASSPPSLAGTLTWTLEDDWTAWNAAHPNAERSDVLLPYATPARLTDLSDLPATYIEVGQRDLYRDAVIDYARRLTQAGNYVELRMRAAVPHAFDVLAPDAAVTRRALAERSDALVRMLNAGGDDRSSAAQAGQTGRSTDGAPR